MNRVAGQVYGVVVETGGRANRDGLTSGAFIRRELFGLRLATIVTAICGERGSSDSQLSHSADQVWANCTRRPRRKRRSPGWSGVSSALRYPPPYGPFPPEQTLWLDDAKPTTSAPAAACAGL